MDFNFKEFCEFLDEIKRTKTPKEKFKCVAEKFKIIRNQLGSESNEKFYQILRLMVPSLDRERDSYNMKEATVARILIKMLDLPEGNDRNVLKKSHLMAHEATDFGDVVHSVIRKYLSYSVTTLTISDLNKYLDDLTKRRNEREGEDILMNIFKKCSSEHMKWVIRIILKDLKLGLGANSILNCYHKDGAAFYASNSNLKKVCDVLQKDSVRLHELEIEINEAFRPMLSKKIDATNFIKLLPENKPFFVENKFDGERFQLHMKNNEFKYFSRNGFDFTESLGNNYDTGTLTPQLKGLFRTNIKKVILDGELMMWHKRSRTFGSKGMTLDVKKLKEIGHYQPCFCIYDIILLNDRILTNVPLRERLQVLKTVFSHYKEGSLQLSQVKEVSSRQEIVDELNFRVDRDEEGIIIKDPDSVYKYSDRNSGWFKMKLEYFQDVMNDLDLILMGGNYEKSTSDWLKSFFVGIRSDDPTNKKPLYLALGKVSSGLNYEELAMLNKKIKTDGKKFEHFNSKSLAFGKDVPQYYIEPEKSLVFTIRASELVRDTHSDFKTHYTLRFPRVLKVRDDKPVDECLHITELLELTQNNKAVIKLNKRNLDLEELLKTKTRKIKRKEIIVPVIYDTAKISDVLEGYNILVSEEIELKQKEYLQSLVKRAGGSIQYILKDKVDIVLTWDRTDYIKELIKKRPKYDIVHTNWLQRVIQDGNLLGYNQEEIFYIGWSFKNCLSDELDKYGDSFTEETDVNKLKNTFEIITDMGDKCIIKNIVKLEGRKYLNHHTAYFDKHSIIGDHNSEIIYKSFLDEIQFQYYGGIIEEKLSTSVNLIIYNGNSDRKRVLQDYLHSIQRTDIEISTNSIIYN
ncbi:unnamed protein product [Phyllotreta striolata]|uniref:DNA ligase 4 n=1 Tax=Phyllotreta striolata TaxID=444603 RepID=A0A9N9TWG7_PHYSR|nr:unnamed protein product [Phyllotreta striolata]